MKLKIYIVTFDGEKHLNHNLNSLFNSDFFKKENINYEINIINNHSNFNINENFKNKVNILHNVLRPDFSTGHLARNWNQAIINGFKNLNNPDCDILIHCQDDIEWKTNWYETLEKIMNKYTFYSCGNGDAFCAYTAEGVKNIGLWDERFCNIGYHEYDYFTRACIYNPDKSSINDLGDYAGNKQWNSQESCIRFVPRDEIKNVNHKKSQQYHSISGKIYKLKWGFDAEPRNFDKINKNVKHTITNNFIFYPYFEKDIYGLIDKKYII